MADDRYEHHEVVYDKDRPDYHSDAAHDRTDDNLSRVQQLVYTFTGILTGLLAIRVVLSLLGANRQNTFADFVYTVTAPLVAPFRGLFGIDTQFGVSRFEIETVVAMAVYLLIAWAVVRLLAVGKHHPAGY